MSTYFGSQRAVWFRQLLTGMQYEIFWQGMHYEMANCIRDRPIQCGESLETPYFTLPHGWK